MSRRRKHSAGLTLMEVLIVSISLGAAVVFIGPRFSRAADLKDQGVRQQMPLIREQMKFYRMQHNGDWPDLLGQQWQQMMRRTDAVGASSASLDPAAAALKPYGPYFEEAPRNPLNQLSKVGDAPGPDVGYVFDRATGQVWATGRNPGKYYNESAGAESADRPPLPEAKSTVGGGESQGSSRG